MPIDLHRTYKVKIRNKHSKEENIKQLKGSWTVAEIEISYKPIITDHTAISSSFQAYELIKQLWDKEKINLQEQFAVLFFNQSKKIIGWKILSTGNMTKCIVDIKLLVSLAVHCMCTPVMWKTHVNCPFTSTLNLCVYPVTSNEAFNSNCFPLYFTGSSNWCSILSANEFVIYVKGK